MNVFLPKTSGHAVYVIQFSMVSISFLVIGNSGVCAAIAAIFVFHLRGLGYAFFSFWAVGAAAAEKTVIFGFGRNENICLLRF